MIIAEAKSPAARRSAAVEATAGPVVIDRRLLELPYRVEVTPQGCLILTPLQKPGLTWEQLATTHPILPGDLKWKVETNTDNQIFMSPPPHVDHQEYGTEIVRLLFALLPGGRPISEAGVQTRDGTREPDVVWASDERRRARGRRASFVLAPEICVEILSPANTRKEIDEKKRLYFEAGALEFWRCDRNGKMAFFDANGTLPRSRLCPDFPTRLDPFA